MKVNLLYLNKLVYGLFVLFLWFISLQYLQTSIPHVKFISYSIFGVILLITFIKVIKLKIIALPNKKIILTIVMYLVWKIIAISFTPFLIQGIKNLLDFIIFIIMSLIIIPIWFTKKQYYCLIFSTVLSVIAFSIMGSYYFDVENDFYRYNDSGVHLRASWMFIHPNLAGLYGLILFFSSLILFENTKKKIYFIVTILSISIPILAMSRTILLVIICLLSLYLYNKIPFFYNNKIKIYFYIYLSFILILVILLNLDYLTYENLNKIFSTRLDIWTNILKSMDSLIFGEGLFSPGENLVYSVEKDGFGLDGVFMNILYNEGIIGLILFLLVITCLVLSVFFSDNNNKNLVNSIFLFSLFYSFTETHFFINNMFTICVLGIIALHITKIIKFS